jgi:hypothetical protein
MSKSLVLLAQLAAFGLLHAVETKPKTTVDDYLKELLKRDPNQALLKAEIKRQRKANKRLKQTK